MKSIIPFMFLVAEAYALPADNLGMTYLNA